MSILKIILVSVATFALVSYAVSDMSDRKNQYPNNPLNNK